MIGAGILGSEGIGYEQDYFAVQLLEKTPDGEATYRRYVAVTEKGDPDAKGFPIVSSIFPSEIPKVAGLDNRKLKVFDSYTKHLAEVKACEEAKKAPPTGPATSVESEVATILKEKAAGKPVEKKLEENLTQLKLWWDAEGLPNYEKDKEPLSAAKMYGAKTALLYTAAVPAGLAVCFLFLILYFALTGGYKQVHLDQEPPMGEY